MYNYDNVSDELNKLQLRIKSYQWVKEFEKEFEYFLEDESIEELKVIVGQSAYKQSLNNHKFKVTNNNYPYNKLGKYVAFFVTDWIKIQDSLEMIFNLLFKGSVNSLIVLAYLRKHEIDASQFSDYLFYRYRILLVNITNHKKHDNYINIRNLIKEFNQSTILLAVGNDAEKYCSNIKIDNISIKIDKCIHPSGNNLNLGNDKLYYKNWYELKSNRGLLNYFCIFKNNPIVPQ